MTMYHRLPPAARLSLYGRILAVPFDIDAVFSDESPEYVRYDADSGTASIRLRLGKGRGAVVFLVSPAGWQEKMQITETSGYFDYYSVNINIIRQTAYYFKIISIGGETYFYNKYGVYIEAADKRVYDFRLIPGFSAPEWVKGAVMYQIFVDRFYNGDSSNDVVNNEYAYMGHAAKALDWDDPIQNVDICNFYGGDLQGVIEKLPYLKDLGIEALYLNPIFVSPSSHKYDIEDYDFVDPHLGVIKNDGGDPLFFERFKNTYATKYIQRVTDPENLRLSNDLFIRLVDEAHKNGIKVILDGVFNHCGAFNKWLDREGFYSNNGYPPGAYHTADSPYRNYFRWDNDAWPDNDYYDCWWGHKNHPKLHFEGSAELYDYILSVAQKWVSPPFCADGWRLDVAADLGYTPEFNHRFWRDFRTAVKSANPEAVIIAEHYGDPSDWLMGDEWDTVMNYDAFMEPLSWFLTGMEKHSQEYKPALIGDTSAFLSAMNRYMSRFTYESLYSAMNQLSNHDHSRFLTRTNKTEGRLHTLGRKAAAEDIDPRLMRLAVMMQMTWPGVPCVYYGDEAGLTGWTDPDNRRPFPWGREDRDMLDFHKAAITMRKRPVLRSGSLEILWAEPGILCYSRTLGGDKVAVVINNTSHEETIRVPVWKLNITDGSFDVLLWSGRSAIEAGGAKPAADNGFLSITVSPYGGIVLAAL